MNATSDWLPGFFRASDGTYVPFDPNSIQVSAQPLPDPRRRRGSGRRRRHADAGNGGEGGTPDGGSRRRTRRRAASTRASSPPTPGCVDRLPRTRSPSPTAAPFPSPRTPDSWPPTSTGTATCSSPGRTRAHRQRRHRARRADQRSAAGHRLLGPVLPRHAPVRRSGDGPAAHPDGRPGLHPRTCSTGAQAGCYVGAGDAPGRTACRPRPGRWCSAPATAPPTLLALAPPLPGGTAGAFGAVRTYLSPNDASPSCGPAWSVFAFPQAQLRPAAPRPTAPSPVASSADGQPAAPGRRRKLRAGRDPGLQRRGRGAQLRRPPRRRRRGAIAGSYLAKVGVPMPSQPLVLGVLQGGTFPRRPRRARSGGHHAERPAVHHLRGLAAGRGRAGGDGARARALRLRLGDVPAGEERAVGDRREPQRAPQQRDAGRRRAALRSGPDAHAGCTATRASPRTRRSSAESIRATSTTSTPSTTTSSR